MKRGQYLIVAGPLVVLLWFLHTYVSPFMTLDVGRLGVFGPRREWLYAHMAGGAVALLLGPVQFWLAASRQNMILHRVLGVGYVMGVLVSSIAGFYLAFHTDFGWVLGTGFAAMSLAWILSTSLAGFAIWRRLIEQHQEWMIRSYVVTSSFVIYRILVRILEVADVGSAVERMTAGSWISWAVPLLITEVILQSRKIFAPRPVVSKSTASEEPSALTVPGEFTPSASKN